MRVIVCGGRDYSDRDTVRRVISALHPDTTVVQGGARGADHLAQWAAHAFRLTVETHPAEWDTHGKAAGPIRNRHMLSLGADLVIAFPGGSGTAHMVTLAQTAGVPVLQVA